MTAAMTQNPGTPITRPDENAYEPRRKNDARGREKIAGRRALGLRARNATRRDFISQGCWSAIVTGNMSVFKKMLAMAWLAVLATTPVARAQTADDINYETARLDRRLLAVRTAMP